MVLDWAGARHAESIVYSAENRGVRGGGLVMGRRRWRRSADDGRRSYRIGSIIVRAYRVRVVRPVVGLAC